ncbi:MAG: hypothetical protein K2K09_02630 [Lachnospiraceae bacterium]|nr:hypothetical protein [Lachnospiraceae bacterium]
MLGIIKSYKRLGKTREDTADYLSAELGLTEDEAMECAEKTDSNFEMKLFCLF